MRHAISQTLTYVIKVQKKNMHQEETGHLQEGVREWDFETVLIHAYLLFDFLKKKSEVNIY